MHKDLPPGIVKYGEKWVESKNIHFSGIDDSCFIKGRFDVVIEFDDGTYGVIDYKTSNPEGEHYKLYSRQLHAYAYALENPAHGALSLSPVSMLGLLYFFPSKVSQQNIDWLSFDSEIHLKRIEKDDQEFMTFIEEVLTLLQSQDLPDPTPECSWCSYQTELKTIEMIEQTRKSVFKKKA